MAACLLLWGEDVLLTIYFIEEEGVLCKHEEDLCLSLVSLLVYVKNTSLSC